MNLPATDRDDAALFTLLYVSELTGPDAADIARSAGNRASTTSASGITGVLVFDGGAFCQFVEGRARPIASLLGRLERDPRHRRMRVLQFGPTTRGRPLPVLAARLRLRGRPGGIADSSAPRAALAAFRDGRRPAAGDPRSEARDGLAAPRLR